MSTYVIGDLQGCIDPLQQLLDHIDFRPDRDRLWFTGDLVNRGPDSLATLRFVYQLRENAITVLGNHDLHLLAVAQGIVEESSDDHLGSILHAPDRDELLHWLRHQPLLHHDADSGFTLIHAGLPPQWDLAMAQSCANELHEVLQGEQYLDFLEHMYGNLPDLWSENLYGHDRLRFITNCFTRLRYCNENGQLFLKAKGPLGTQPAGVIPWFQVSHRRSRDLKILFGHWSALGLHLEPGVYGLDSGCLWGGALTALRLEDERIFSVPCEGYRRISHEG